VERDISSSGREKIPPVENISDERTAQKHQGTDKKIQAALYYKHINSLGAARASKFALKRAVSLD
jgi:hypothetical protein